MATMRIPDKKLIIATHKLDNWRWQWWVEYEGIVLVEGVETRRWVAEAKAEAWCRERGSKKH